MRKSAEWAASDLIIDDSQVCLIQLNSIAATNT